MSLGEPLTRNTFENRRANAFETFALLALALSLLLEPLTPFSSAGADVLTAPPFDENFWRWEMGYAERLEGPYGTYHVVGRSWGYCFYYDGELRWITDWGPALKGIKGGVTVRVRGHEKDMWTYAGFYTKESIKIPEGNFSIRVRASIKAVQDFVAKPTYDPQLLPSRYPYRARADVYFQVCLIRIIREVRYEPGLGWVTEVEWEGYPSGTSWENASVGYLQHLFTLRVGEKVSTGTTWTPEIAINTSEEGIEPGEYYIYFGLLAHTDAELSIYDEKFYQYVPWDQRNDCAFQFESVEITFTPDLAVNLTADPRVILPFTSPEDWRLEDEDSAVELLPRGWAEPSDPSGPTKLAFGDFFRPNVYVQVQGSPGVKMTVSASFPKEYFWTIDPSDPFNRALYADGGSFEATKEITEDDLRSGWVRFQSDKVFRAKLLQGVDYVDVPVVITVSYGGGSKDFTIYVRLASIRPEVHQIWLSPSSCVIRVYGLWCDDNSPVKNRPYLYYGLDLETRRVCLKTGIDSSNHSYAESDSIDPQILRPTGHRVNGLSSIPMTPATDEFALESNSAEYRELALSVLQRDSSGFKLRVYEHRAPDYAPVPRARVTLVVKDLGAERIWEVTKTAYSDGTVYFARGELSLPVSGYEVWAIAWCSEATGVLYARGPFGCILLEKA